MAAASTPRSSLGSSTCRACGPWCRSSTGPRCSASGRAAFGRSPWAWMRRRSWRRACSRSRLASPAARAMRWCSTPRSRRDSVRPSATRCCSSRGGGSPGCGSPGWLRPTRCGGSRRARRWWSTFTCWNRCRSPRRRSTASALPSRPMPTAPGRSPRWAAGCPDRSLPIFRSAVRAWRRMSSTRPIWGSISSPR